MQAVSGAHQDIGYFFGIRGRDSQAPADAAVIITTVLRPSLQEALRSVYRQDFPGSIQVLIGIDKAHGPMEPLLQLLEERPAHVGALVLNPGYSTSVRHGGLHHAFDGGAMRVILSYLANSRLLAYLDDDNLWLPNHLGSLAAAIRGFDWAYSLRTFFDGRNGRDLCMDIWDSVGPGKGNKRDTPLGGFVDPNCLMIDKSRAEGVLQLWSLPVGGSRVTADRRVFHRLRTRHPVAWTGLATVRYAIRPGFYLWPAIADHLRRTGGTGVALPPYN